MAIGTTHDAAAVEAMYRGYIRDYPAAVGRALDTRTPIDFASLGFWQFPLLNLVGGAPQIVDEAEFAARFDTLYAQARAEGWGGRIDLDAVAVAMAGRDHAVIRASGARCRDDGERLSRWASTYLCRRHDREWRVFGIAPGDDAGPKLQAWASWLSGVGHAGSTGA